MGMPALVLCICFVIFLLHLDRKQAPELSHALWIPTVWMLYASSKPLGTWFDIVGTTAETGSLVDQIFMIVLTALAFLTLVWRRFYWWGVVSEHPCLMLLFYFMLSSIIWSDIPSISFRRWVKELVPLVIAFVILTEPNPRQAVQSIIRRMLYILIPFSIVLIKFFPYYGRQYARWSGKEMWIGVCLQKNGLSEICIVSTLFLVWTFVKRRQGNNIPVHKYLKFVEVILFIMVLYLLKGPPGAYSATSVAVLAVGLTMFFIFLRMKKHQSYPGANILMIIVAFGIALGIALPIVGVESIGAAATLLGREDTLTGRTEIWAGLLPSAMENFFLGHGFGGFWTTETEEAHGEKSAHNGYLEVFLEIGMIGLMVTAIYLLSCLRKFYEKLSDDFDWASFSICYLIMAVLHNMAESTFESFTSHIMVVLLFLALSSTTESYQASSMLQEKLDITHNMPKK
jgi:exopolysaccharide production protein ExoQ